ncbi:unnamed protein product [Cuscuta europaea]|uniref:Gnk2-homologous domain-containing protein n=1 Tax=Cuscuta europaea TaxID=41803 RepID=A0A9P0YSF5_CUSEU|nr:unnamed protein product [Cuscuta europaea]
MEQSLFPTQIFPGLMVLITSFAVICSCLEDYNAIVLKGCSQKKLDDRNENFSRTLDGLSKTLYSKSSSANFSRATARGGAVSGLFQCRGDLSPSDCSVCVEESSKQYKMICGGDSVAGRIQLVGCYISFEVSSKQKVDSTHLLLKECGLKSGRASSSVLAAAFKDMAKQVKVSGNRFYSGSFGGDGKQDSDFVDGSLTLMGQCEGDLGRNDCAACLDNATALSRSLCGNGTDSANIYLQRCFMSYSFAFSKRILPDNFDINKIVSIIMTPIVIVAFAIVIFLYIKSALKTDHQKAKGVWG